MESIELMIGKLQGTMEGIKDDVALLTKEVKTLPCATRDQMLEQLNIWKRTCNGTVQTKQIESFKGGITLKNQLIIIGVTNLITLVLALIAAGLKP